MNRADKAGGKWDVRVFDDLERGKVRRDLKRFMAERDIGVPTLQHLIALANQVSPHQIPLKSLQRFLADSHRTSDTMVSFFDRFVERSIVSQAFEKIGGTLADYLAVTGPLAGSLANKRATPPRSLLGRYQAFRKGPNAERATEGSTTLRRPPVFEVAHSQFVIDAVDDAPFLRITELPVEPAQLMGPSSIQLQGAPLSESLGVLTALARADSYLAVMREGNFHQPRLLLLWDHNATPMDRPTLRAISISADLSGGIETAFSTLDLLLKPLDGPVGSKLNK